MDIVEGGPVQAFCGWFDVQFKGSDESPADTPVTLTTAPDPTGGFLMGRGCVVFFGWALQGRGPPDKRNLMLRLALSTSNPSQQPPSTIHYPIPGATHWGQQSFYVVPPVECSAGERLKASIKVDRRKDNHRLLAVEMGVGVEGQPGAPRELKWNIE
jgi:protein arginine N-methyltransferase 1